MYGINNPHPSRPNRPIFLSRVTILARDIDIAILSVRPSVRLLVCPSRSSILWKRLNILS